MRPRTIAAACAILALPSLAAADCAPPRIAGDWLLLSDWDLACRIAVDVKGAFTTTSCRGSAAAYSGHLTAAADCAVDLRFWRHGGGGLERLRGTGWLAADQSRIDGYYIEPGAGAVGLSLLREPGSR